MSHGTPYPLQVLQLVALQDAQLDLLLPVELLLEAIANVDIRRSTFESLHFGQVIDVKSLIEKHNSSNSLSQ